MGSIIGQISGDQCSCVVGERFQSGDVGWGTDADGAVFHVKRRLGVPVVNRPGGASRRIGGKPGSSRWTAFRVLLVARVSGTSIFPCSAGTPELGGTV